MPSEIEGTPGLRHLGDGGSAVSRRVAWVESRSSTAWVSMDVQVVRKRGSGQEEPRKLCVPQPYWEEHGEMLLDGASR